MAFFARPFLFSPHQPDKFMSNLLKNAPLGKTSAYIDTYSPELLFPILRAENRKSLDIQADQALPFQGVDIWNGYELSWLTPSGKPAVELAEFTVPADSACIIESKSFKLYLNSLNQTMFESVDQLKACLIKDLSHACGSSVQVNLMNINDPNILQISQFEGLCIDTLEVAIDRYSNPTCELLEIHENKPTQAQLYSHLLKSNCPVTGQPDWGSVFISYLAACQLDTASLLRYIISFRQYSDFHEHCVERIFMDLCQKLHPEKLEVFARYTRRGGLDINPYRSLRGQTQYTNLRLVRQ